MGDVNLEIKLSNLDERVIKIEDSGGGSGGDGYITSVSNDFNVVNKKLSLSNDVTTKLSKVDDKIDKPTSATEGQVLTYRNNEWVADDSQGGGQFVIIAKGETYEGQTVTATKGTKSKSAVITSGVARISVDEGGVWTLTLSSGETWNTPNMTYYGEYEVALVPNGSTVTPTDDIQTWLHCANIWDKTDITTIGGVLTDTTTLNTLISDNNAVDYMVRSTTWASDVCNNESAMTYIGLNDYCANKLLADSTWCTAICDSPHFDKVLNVNVPTIASDTTPYGNTLSSPVLDGLYAYKAFDDIKPTSNQSFEDWGASTTGTSVESHIGFKFNSPVCVKKIYMEARLFFPEGYPSRFNIEGSNSEDFSGYTTLKTIEVSQAPTAGEKFYYNVENDNYFLCYRIHIFGCFGDRNGLGRLQFYGREEV